MLFLCVKAFSINDSLIASLKKELKQNNLNQKTRAHYFFSIGTEYSKLNKADSSFLYYTNALKLYEKVDSYEEFMKCNYSIFKLLNSQSKLNTNSITYLDSYFKYAKKNKDTIKLIRANASYATLNYTPEKYNKAIEYYNKAIQLSINLKDTLRQAKLNTNLGLLYSGFVSQDSARFFFDKSLKLYKPEDVDDYFSTYINYANSYEKENKYEESISFLKKAELITPSRYKDNLNKKLYKKLSFCYNKIDDYKNAFAYFEKYNLIKDKIDLTTQNIAISDIKEQYDNEKLRADNLEIEAGRKRNENLLFGALGLLLFGSITAFLVQKNTKRKQLLAEQDREIEKQKVATLLKDQEINSINAMIEGQEKERQRIANDLHDDLGGLMATVKLHFNILKEKQTPDLYTKTNLLIDEAYKKIRTIAHEKNSGVIAKQGLLKAIKEMAAKVSVSNTITIDVIDFGLENRLKNSLELTIFRIIQELVTNIIKHAEATDVSIHITNHEDTLNIMVEDNGKGFNSSQVTKTNRGMGISSIDKRVEHLNGKMTIESEKDKGTTIIIDIPL